MYVAQIFVQGCVGVGGHRGYGVRGYEKLNWQLKKVNYFTCMQHFFVGGRDPQKLI